MLLKTEKEIGKQNKVQNVKMKWKGIQVSWN